MTTIKITDERAIIINDNSIALAKWATRKTKDKATGKYNVENFWSEYLWPSNIDRAVEHLVQEFVSDMELTMTMKEFKVHYEGFIEHIKSTINGKGN